jgi:hypothetical protein
MICVAEEESDLGHEGDLCETWNESAGTYYPGCAEGLVCEAQDDMVSTSGSYMICVVEEEADLGHEGDYCLTWNEDAGTYYPDCDEGLVCTEQEDENGNWPSICIVDTTDYGEGADGTWRGNTTDSNGYWFLNSDDTAGYWVSDDGQVTGDWVYDDGSTSTGTWWFEGDSSWIGTWATDESDDTVKYDSTDYEEYMCIDLDNGEVNTQGYACDWYW